MFSEKKAYKLGEKSTISNSISTDTQLRLLSFEQFENKTANSWLYC